MTGEFFYTETCQNTLTGSGYVIQTDCIHTISYDEFRDFIFNNIILVVVGVYFFIKILRFMMDLFFNTKH